MTKKKKRKNPIIEGQIRISAGGTGYITDENGKDIRIPHRDLNLALNGDTVKIRRKIKTKGKDDTGRVEEVLKRKKDKFVGTFYREDGLSYISPDDKRMYTDILIPKNKTKKAKEGQKVYAKIFKWTTPKKDPLGEVIEVIGKKGEHETEIRSIILENQIDTDFPKEVLQEVEKMELDITPKILNERRDMRKVSTFTIDPIDAKDFDDALSIKKLPNGNFEIGIHIADVSHYVKPGTNVDKEARERAFSSYLVDRTIPMLPEKLSNDICSLKAAVERLAFSAVFELNMEGNVEKRWYGKTVINSDKRFNYLEAQKVIDGKKGHYQNDLQILNDIAKKLRSKRFAKGSILFEKDEVEIELDKNGSPVKIYKKERVDTHKMVEEFMLLANKEVAEHIEHHCKSKDLKKVFLFRIHDLPDQERLQELSTFIRAFGYDADFDGEIKPKEINDLLNKVKGKPEEDLINRALIRTMSKAEYSTKNIGHFGLGFKFYTHFTSPIRRYPDLLVHRLLKKHLDDSPISKEELQKNQRIAMEASKREIEIARAERDSIKMKQVEYMKEHIGEKFEAIISGVTDWGLYVEEVNTGAEGLVKLSDIEDDYYEIDKKYTIKGQKKGRKFRLGDKVKVKLVHADVDERNLDFVFV